VSCSQKVLLYLFIGFLSFSFISCRKKTDEDWLSSILEDVEEFIEKKDIESLMALIADDYQDFASRDKKTTRRMVQGYFNEYQGIVAHMLGIRYNYLDDQTADMETEVILSSGGAKFFRKLIRYAGDIYHIRLRWIKDAESWRIQFAKWEYVTIDEIFPESFSILKELFPNLER
jgi:hypothetical protein